MFGAALRLGMPRDRDMLSMSLAALPGAYGRAPVGERASLPSPPPALLCSDGRIVSGPTAGRSPGQGAGGEAPEPGEGARGTDGRVASSATGVAAAFAEAAKAMVASAAASADAVLAALRETRPPLQPAASAPGELPQALSSMPAAATDGAAAAAAASLVESSLVAAAVASAELPRAGGSPLLLVGDAAADRLALKSRSVAIQEEAVRLALERQQLQLRQEGRVAAQAARQHQPHALSRRQSLASVASCESSSGEPSPQPLLLPQPLQVAGGSRRSSLGLPPPASPPPAAARRGSGAAGGIRR